ncbi:MAG: Gfo/Idh/MocA family oxidoreductase [Nakamurella sp.]
MANLKAGLIGLGMMGRHHARVLSNLDGVDLVAVADPAGDPHHVAGGRPVLDSIQGIIDAGVDYCMVAVPTAYHLEVGMALAEAGIHALIEKPLAKDTASARQLTEAFASAGLIGGVGHIERFNPALQSARARIENGDLGEVFQVATRRQGPFPNRISDVGVIFDLASHDVDLTAWVVHQRFARVSAFTAKRSGRPFEDLVAMSGELEGGTVTDHLVNWLSPLKERVTTITGERGAFVANTLTAELTFYANGASLNTWDDLAQFRGVTEGDVIRYGINKPEPLRTEHEHFRDAVLGKDTDFVTMQQGLDTVIVCEAAVNSAASGQTITLLEKS